MSIGDVVLDTDALHSALSMLPSHDHIEDVMQFAFSARNAVIDTLERSGYSGHVWIITTAATRSKRDYWKRLAGASIVLLNPGLDVCLKRAAIERPLKWRDYVLQWFRAYENDLNGTRAQPSKQG